MDNKRNIKRDSLRYNTLNECIMRVDFMKINNMDKLLKELDKMLGRNYSFKTNEVFNIDLEIQDPKTLMTQELIKNNINKSINYEYYTATEKFIINEYVLIFSKRIFNNYTGISEYQKDFEKIINEVIESEFDINISRLGVRKKNIIYSKDTYDLREILNDDYIPRNLNNKMNEINVTSKELCTDLNSFSYNHCLSIKKGNAKKDNEKLIVNRIILDIDYYKRDINKEELNISEYNDKIFDAFKQMLNQDFLTSLVDGSVIDNENIIWGINENDTK